MTDARGTPLAVITTPANVNDAEMAMPLVDAMPPIGGPRGRPRQKPGALLGDRAYGTAKNIAACRERRIVPMLARPRSEHGSGLGILRYVVEGCMAWFGNFRRIKLCYERTGAHFQAFHELAAARILAKKLGAL